jgi:hypothetical protein
MLAQRLVGRWLLPRRKRAATMKMISKTSMTSERRDIHAVHFPKLVSAVRACLRSDQSDAKHRNLN